MMGSSESLYKRKGYTLGGEQSLSLELSICTHGSELETDGFKAEGPAVSQIDQF